MNNEEKIIGMLEQLFVGQQETNQRLDKLEQNQKKLELHIENVTDKNIRIVAEQHGDIVHRLDNLESDMEDVKDSVSVLKVITARK